MTIENSTFLSNQRGITLVELLVASITSAIVVGTLFFAWRNLSTHTIKGRQSATFQMETTSFAKRIAKQIAHSSNIYFWDGTTVSFASPKGSDTITYSWEGDRLTRNKEDVAFATATIRVTEFSLSRKGDPLTSAAEGLLSLHVAFDDERGNKNTVDLDIAVRLPEKGDRNFGSGDPW